MNYEDDIRIDPDILDVEWLGQPRLMMEYCVIAAEARRALDTAKESLDLVKAELDKDVRINPEKYDITKITESAVQNTIITQRKYQTANEVLSQARYDFDIANSAVRAVDQRKDALEQLVKLHGQQYFAGPKIPHDLSKEWEARENQKSSNSKISMKRKINQ